MASSGADEGSGLVESIRALEQESRQLEPAGAARAALREAVVGLGERFLEGLGTARAFSGDGRAALELREAPLDEAPTPLAELLDQLERCLIEPGLKPASGGHLAYIPGGGLYLAALGDYLAAVTNEYATVRYAGPGAVELETRLVRWMASLVGLPAGAGGHLASGGSTANLAALVAAREACGVRAVEVPRAVVYLTEHTHHCVEKALRIAGLGECVRRLVEVDERRRMSAPALAQAVAVDRAAGLRPFLVVATAGSTDLGAIDPLERLAEIAGREGLWLHVDAAYGGFFVLCEEVRERLAGLSRADSLVMDPHKGLFLPYGVGAVLLRDEAALRRAFAYDAAYLQDLLAPAEGEPVDPAELSPELSRHFRGLRLWLPLRVHGVAAFRAALREKLALARYFHRRITALGFEAGPEPELSVVTYRWVPERGDADAFNRALLARVLADGRVFLSSTTVDGHFVLRLAVLSFRSHLEQIELALELLDAARRELSGR